MEHMMLVKVIHILAGNEVHPAVPFCVQRLQLFHLRSLLCGKGRKIFFNNVSAAGGGHGGLECILHRYIWWAEFFIIWYRNSRARNSCAFTVPSGRLSSAAISS